MAVLQGGRQNLPPHVCVIQKTPCGIGLTCSIYCDCKVNDCNIGSVLKNLVSQILYFAIMNTLECRCGSVMNYLPEKLTE